MNLCDFRTSFWRFAALASTTFFRSSTEYEMTPSASEQSGETFRGTEMSTSMSGSSRPWRSAAERTGSLLEVAAKTTSLWRTTSSILSMGATFALAPPRAETSSSSALALSVDLLTRVSWMLGSLLKRAMSRSLDILPAPRMQTCTLLEYFRRSASVLAIISSTAALDTETEPLPIFVRVRTSFPVRMPSCSILAMIFPPAPATAASSSGLAFSMQRPWHALT
mmetsp:Transcript_87594/g.232543  ORF Transcript_87594/g.232543 Transcript_87594/m.232543 type:complete len:223 (+) Transcript_87594:430-1098(+)